MEFSNHENFKSQLTCQTHNHYLESKRISLKIPNINGDFENIVIDNKYGLFVAAIVAFNDERVDQSTCERAWESLVYEKFYKWQPEDMTIKEKADVLGEALAQVGGYPGFNPHEWWNNQSPIDLALAEKRVLAAKEQLRIAKGLVRALNIKELVKSSTVDLDNAAEPMEIRESLNTKRKYQPKQGLWKNGYLQRDATTLPKDPIKAEVSDYIPLSGKMPLNNEQSVFVYRKKPPTLSCGAPEAEMVYGSV